MHFDIGYLNEIKARSRTGACIFLYEDYPATKPNGLILTIIQIIKAVMSSASEVELIALLVTTKRMIPFRHTLVEMGWHQPKSPIQTDKSTEVGFLNKTIVVRATTSVDIQLWWLGNCEYQNRFKYYWSPRPTNKVDYSTKHHPMLYHEAKRVIHVLQPTLPIFHFMRQNSDNCHN